jgi:D-glycero-alpha-D-manno-heptose-7-phosphate kinase
MRLDRGTASVRARAPLRLGLAGGGTDIPAYSSQFGGLVLNATIDRYAFAFINPREDGQLVLRARGPNIEEAMRPDEAAGDGALPLHRAVYRRMIAELNRGEPVGLTLSTFVDSPPGAGLGSSSALVVAMVEAFARLFDRVLGPYDLARLAFEIERIDCGLAGGKQDHYAAAFGGVNYIEFLESDRVIVNPLRVPTRHLNDFETALVICFSGRSRASEAIIRQQQDGILAQSPETIAGLHQLKAEALDMKEALLGGRMREIAEILARSWAAKKQTAQGISNPRLESLIAAAERAGAWAGKVSGAGGGGFMMFVTAPEDRPTLIEALNAAGGQAGGIKFTAQGSESWLSTS